MELKNSRDGKHGKGTAFSRADLTDDLRHVTVALRRPVEERNEKERALPTTEVEQSDNAIPNIPASTEPT
jgi:hypothetical protein